VEEDGSEVPEGTIQLFLEERTKNVNGQVGLWTQRPRRELTNTEYSI
jgi:hypothetical protein